MEEVEVGNDGRKSRSKMLSKVAWKICVLCCVFFKTEKRDIYIGAKICLKIVVVAVCVAMATSWRHTVTHSEIQRSP